MTVLTQAPCRSGYNNSMSPTATDVASGTLRFEQRFQGFANGALGGYVAGAVAKRIGGPAEVNLRSLPPLDRDLELRETDEGALVLSDGDTTVLDAHRSGFELDVPAPPSWDAALAAAEHLMHHEHAHPYPGCFACGPGRAEGDGLRLFIGRGEDPEGPLVSAWTPHPALGAEDGTLAPEMLWAALDCPTIWAAWSDSRPARPREGRLTVLARQRLEQLRPVPAGEPAIVTAWAVEREGRKCLAGAAIHDREGELLVRADSLLVDVPAPGSAA